MHIDPEAISAECERQFSTAVIHRLPSNLTAQGYLQQLCGGLCVLEGSEVGFRAFSFPSREIISLKPENVERAMRRLGVSSCHVSTNQDFEAVLVECSKRRIGQTPEDNWIGEKLRNIFLDLHKQGFAHSVEVWRNRELVGGVFGLQLGGAFISMSTFHQISDAGKGAGNVGIAGLIYMLHQKKFCFLDVISPSNLSRSFGGRSIRMEYFFIDLRQAMRLKTRFPRLQPTPTTELISRPSRLNSGLRLPQHPVAKL